MDERMKALSEVTDLIQEGIRKEWTMREFGEIFLATLALPTIAKASHDLSEALHG